MYYDRFIFEWPRLICIKKMWHVHMGINYHLVNTHAMSDLWRVHPLGLHYGSWVWSTVHVSKKQQLIVHLIGATPVTPIICDPLKNWHTIIILASLIFLDLHKFLSHKLICSQLGVQHKYCYILWNIMKITKNKKYLKHFITLYFIINYFKST